MERTVKIFLPLLFCVTVFSCGMKHPEETAVNKIIPKDITANTDTVAVIAEKPFDKLTVLVLPPFDPIANEGISPDIQKFLEEALAKDSSLTVIPFPFKKLMNVPYYQVFDAKYCGPILQKAPVDIVVMSKLDKHSHTGNMERDGWDVSLRIFNTKTDQQVNSGITIPNRSAEDIRKDLAARCSELVTEILHTAEPK